MEFKEGYKVEAKNNVFDDRTGSKICSEGETFTLKTYDGDLAISGSQWFIRPNIKHSVDISKHFKVVSQPKKMTKKEVLDSFNVEVVDEFHYQPYYNWWDIKTH